MFNLILIERKKPEKKLDVSLIVIHKTSFIETVKQIKPWIRVMESARNGYLLKNIPLKYSCETDRNKKPYLNENFHSPLENYSDNTMP